ncbi:hypothetical protein AVEN_2121-1 [Araneus ventricosus]|uniref:Uncharacterized protein n=1 Tax=Araneus ventricosus TaxID=182803 RepID=A0A4Y2EBU3_ARAVE|nr:hypothetical protein AVEN_2121-1 [Araneus ventricosus]
MDSKYLSVLIRSDSSIYLMSEEDPEESDLQRFIGNESYSDYFKLLEQDADSLLVGARNIVYNISLQSLQEQKPQRPICKVSASKPGVTGSKPNFNEDPSCIGPSAS